MKSAERDAAMHDQGVVRKLGSLAVRGIERWKHGLAIMLMLFMIAASSALAAVIPLSIASEVFGLPSLVHWRTVTLVTALTTLPYFLTSPGFAKELQTLLGIRRGK